MPEDGYKIQVLQSAALDLLGQLLPLGRVNEWLVVELDGALFDGQRSDLPCQVRGNAFLGYPRKAGHFITSVT